MFGPRRHGGPEKKCRTKAPLQIHGTLVIERVSPIFRSHFPSPCLRALRGQHSIFLTTDSDAKALKRNSILPTRRMVEGDLGVSYSCGFESIRGWIFSNTILSPWFARRWQWHSPKAAAKAPAPRPVGSGHSRRADATPEATQSGSCAGGAGLPPASSAFS